MVVHLIVVTKEKERSLAHEKGRVQTRDCPDSKYLLLILFPGLDSLSLPGMQLLVSVQFT